MYVGGRAGHFQPCCQETGAIRQESSFIGHGSGQATRWRDINTSSRYGGISLNAALTRLTAASVDCSACLNCIPSVNH